MSVATASMPKVGIKNRVSRTFNMPARKPVQATVSAAAGNTYALGATKEERSEMWDRFLKISAASECECHPSIVGFTEDTFMDFVNDEIDDYHREKREREKTEVSDKK